MKKIEVFDGNELQTSPVQYRVNNPYCAFHGILPDGKDVSVPLDADLFISIIIPNSVISIGNTTFRECCQLERVVIPNSVRDIGKYAFYKCTCLTSIVIPDGVKKDSEIKILGIH